jgi:lysophospholipase L1-like esterase
MFRFLLACAPLFLGLLPVPHSAAEPVEMAAFQKDGQILFQGDSITDGNRGRSADPNHILGHGYVFIIAAKYGAAFPERNLNFMNRGVSGNKVADLAARWQKDTLDLKPDLLSILIGVNDALRVPVEQYEETYDKLLQQTLAALPKVRLVLCEPFTLPVGAKKAVWEEWSADVKTRQAVVEKLAAKYHAPVVHFQKVFDEACQRAPADYWIWDGVHPTYRGHQLMADEWVRVVAQFYGAGR